MVLRDDMAAVAVAGQQAGDGSDEDTLLMWILVWSELVAFGILLAAFLFMSGIHAEDFGLARLHLSPGLAAANTLILLISGWQAAIAVRHRTEPNAARRPLCIAAVFGLLFVAVKFVEYAGELRYTMDATLVRFFELYFILTGFHLLHVAFGATILFLVAWRPSRGNILLITTLWHVIDLVWLVMFPIVYLA